MALGDLREKLNSSLENLARRIIEKAESVPSLPALLKKESTPLKIFAFLTAGILLGDLAALGLGQYLSNAQKEKGRSASLGSNQIKVIREKPYLLGRASFEAILSQNKFCPGCPIPDSKALAFSRPKDCSRARPAAGAIKILGTIVLSEAKFSVATLTDGGESQAFKIGDSFKNYGTLFEIRRNRVCFEQPDGLLTFVENPEDPVRIGQNLPSSFDSASKTPTEGISAVSETEVEIAKPFLMEKLSDPSILMQAHAVPFKDSTGAIKGFKILSIVPGSVYETMGFQPNDVIVGVNGEPMNSIARAQELYAAAGTAQEVNIEIERGGNRVTRTFKVK